jgi:hypothetical protein
MEERTTLTERGKPGSARRYRYLPQYLFFVRYSLAFGFALILFPIAGPIWSPSVLANLFQLGPMGIGLVTVFACLCAWSVVYTGLLIWTSMPLRVGLRLHGADQQAWQSGQQQLPPIPKELVTTRWALVSLLVLVGPLWLRLIAEADDARWGGLAILIGLLTALGIRRLGARFATIPPPREVGTWMPFRAAYEQVTDLYKEGDPPGTHVRDYRILHWRAFLFAVVTAVVYLALGALTGPATSLSAWVPALAYVLALVSVAVWLLGFAAFQYDVWRVPTLGLIALTLIGATVLMPFRYRYLTTVSTSSPLDAHTALTARLGEKETAIVISASGGGITASLWTAHVLNRLGATIPGFHSNVTLISAVSGGALGSLYYVDAFDATAVPAMDEVERISAESSLAAAVWGLTFLDVHRAYAGWLFGHRDRGWALEQRWATQLVDGERSLGDWSAGIRAGWRPIALWGATFQETGERWILAPVTIPARRGSGRRDVREVIPGRDMKLVTAVRLSASFPYVSPHPRADAVRASSLARLHAADGGYYDNSGIVSALDVVDGWLQGHRPTTLRRVALVEIRASGPIDDARREPTRDSIIGALRGPLETLLEMRTTSQLARNQREIELTQKAWRQDYKVEMKHFAFLLSSDQPLSWHLTDTQKESIRSHWPSSEPDRPKSLAVAAIAAANDRTRADLAGFLENRQQ